MTKFINIKTNEKVDMVEGEGIFYQPYLGYLRDPDGNIMGHAHQAAYFDKQGDEYRKYMKVSIGTLTPLDIDYNKELK